MFGEELILQLSISASFCASNYPLQKAIFDQWFLQTTTPSESQNFDVRDWAKEVEAEPQGNSDCWKDKYGLGRFGLEMVWVLVWVLPSDSGRKKELSSFVQGICMEDKCHIRRMYILKFWQSPEMSRTLPENTNEHQTKKICRDSSCLEANSLKITLLSQCWKKGATRDPSTRCGSMMFHATAQKIWGTSLRDPAGRPGREGLEAGAKGFDLYHWC